MLRTHVYTLESTGSTLNREQRQNFKQTQFRVGAKNEHII